MKSKWFEYKEAVVDLRRKGTSMTVIEREFGIPRSTLSGWFKEVVLTEDQRTKLMKNSQDGWKKARESAVITKNLQKAQRITDASVEASRVYASLPTSSLGVLELSLAMLYFGEGRKRHSTGIGASDPFMLNFFLVAIEKIYGLDRQDFRYDLHLRDDQDVDIYKKLWEKELKLNQGKVGYATKDKRTIGKPTQGGYKGVCQIDLGNIAIQRRLISLYNVYCKEVIKGD
jgi:hypothetical protein